MGDRCIAPAIAATAAAAAAPGWSGRPWSISASSSAVTLAITSTANQDNPLMDVAGIERGTPVLGLDVWEHAYYLKYQNRRIDYITALVDCIHWEFVEKRFEELTA